jgi:choline-sulfatase
MTVRNKETKPNILFIMDDQHRFDYLGCSGADFLSTPNIDQLAKKGARFTNCFTNAPVCAPSRIGLATGYQPSRLGAQDNSSYLPRNVPTYYQRLRDYGYRVGCVGKLDLAKPDPYNGRFGDRPCVYGWGFTHPEECEGKQHAGSSLKPRGPYSFYLQERGLLVKLYEDYRRRAAKNWVIGASHDSVLQVEDFQDVYIGRRAAQWIERIPDDFPWHLFVSFAGPHDPFDPPTEYAKKYRDVDVPASIGGGTSKKPNWIRRRQKSASPEQIIEIRRQYCAAIELIDDQVGLILQALEKRGMTENTFIVFASDHGEMLGDHNLFGKHVAYEASIRCPLICAGLGIKNGLKSDALMELIDLNPTICELAGLPAQQNIDALSFATILYGEKETHREDVVSTELLFRCIRSERYKYIQNINESSELYDLDEDPLEQGNIADQNPELVQSLQLRLKNRFTGGKWQH